MSDPAAALQRAIFVRLSSALAGAPVGGRIFDRPRANGPWPYVSFSTAQTIEDGNDCADGAESFLDLDIWSREVGAVEAKHIGSAIWTALNRADLDLDGHALVELQLSSTRYFRDPDGLTTHGVVTLRALTEVAP